MNLKNILVRLGAKSKSETELMPSLPKDFSEIKDYRDLSILMEQIAHEGIQPGMTELEAHLVRDCIKSLFRMTNTWYDSAQSDAEYRFLRTEALLERSFGGNDV